MKRKENLAIRTRGDWKELLCMDVSDPGSNFGESDEETFLNISEM